MSGGDAKKNIAVNTAYTIAGALILNGVLQLLIYPRLAMRLGAEANGTVLYLMGFVNILGPSIGQALNNSRLVLRRDMDVRNGDYNTVVLAVSAVGAAVVAAAAGKTAGSVAAVIMLSLLIVLTDFRYYGDVEYRLSLDYRAYFIYYALCSAGYAIGFLLYLAGLPWYVIFITGEALAIGFIVLKGSIFKKPFERGPCFDAVCRRGGILILSYFVTNLTLNIDRIFLKHSLGGTAVSNYYAVSLPGKTLVLFIAPINTILISYLTKGNTRIGRKSFARFAAIGAAVSAAFYVLCVIGTPIFIRLFYPSYAEATAPVVGTVSFSQILAMYSAYLFIIVLTMASERWQLALQIAHLCLMLALIFPMTERGALPGFSLAVLIANLARVAAVLLLGFISAGRVREETPA